MFNVSVPSVMLTLEKEGRYNASEMSWHVWNPAYVRPAGMLVNFRAGEDGKVPVQAGECHEAHFSGHTHVCNRTTL